MTTQLKFPDWPFWPLPLQLSRMSLNETNAILSLPASEAANHDNIPANAGPLDEPVGWLLQLMLMFLWIFSVSSWWPLFLIECLLGIGTCPWSSVFLIPFSTVWASLKKSMSLPFWLWGKYNRMDVDCIFFFYILKGKYRQYSSPMGNICYSQIIYIHYKSLLFKKVSYNCHMSFQGL